MTRHTLGLKKRTVLLVPYQSKWAKDFLAQKQRIDDLLELAKIKAAIEHVGSTAVKGLCAKPILDIAVGFSTYDDLFKARQVLNENGYDYVPAANRPGMVFMALGEGEIRTVHLHLVVRGSHAWQNLVVVRDYLRRHPSAAAVYAAEKRRLAKQFPEDRVHYAQGKNPTIETIALKALAAYDLRRFQAARSRSAPSRSGWISFATRPYQGAPRVDDQHTDATDPG